MMRPASKETKKTLKADTRKRPAAAASASARGAGKRLKRGQSTVDLGAMEAVTPDDDVDLLDLLAVGAPPMSPKDRDGKPKVSPPHLQHFHRHLRLSRCSAVLRLQLKLFFRPWGHNMFGVRLSLRGMLPPLG